MPHLNIPLVVTIVGDYCWMATYWLVAYTLASNSKLNGLTGAIVIMYTPVANAAREQLYYLWFRQDFASCKTEFRILQHREHWNTIAATFWSVTALVYAACRFGFLHCRFDETNFSNTALTVSMDYWLANLIKDNTSMRFIHKWMHEKQNYWIHKRHHQGNKDVCYLHGAFLFDLLDLTIEFSIGPVLGMWTKYYILGMDDPSLHLVAFMFSVWTDGNIHSENPYTQAIGNPILDWIMKPNLTHNLHHAFVTDPKYMTIFPMHHLFSPAAREKDLERYNKIMKTNINFSIFRPLV